MKRWNWPTTILYIKHKKANLKQGCSKLVGKKRKAPTGGWSGGLNCPIGTGKKKPLWHIHVPERGAARPRHSQASAQPGQTRHGRSAALAAWPGRARCRMLSRSFPRVPVSPKHPGAPRLFSSRVNTVRSEALKSD